MAWLADGQRPLCVAKAELDDEKSQVRLSKVGLEIFLYNLQGQKSQPKNRHRKIYGQKIIIESKLIVLIINIFFDEFNL